MTEQPNQQLHDKLSKLGLSVLGQMTAEATDSSYWPKGADQMFLIVNAGDQFWPIFSTSPEYKDGHEHPLDRWAKRVLSNLADELDLQVLFPFQGPPYYPFISWAVEMTGLSPSPIGPLLHPQYGTWFAFRGALFASAGQKFSVSSDKLPIKNQDDPSLCEQCIEKPCLNACPVGAIRPDQPYDVDACRTYVNSEHEPKCIETSCQARLRCPYGQDYVYTKNQIALHMKAFARS